MEPTINESTLPLGSVQPEIKDGPFHDSVGSDVTQSENDVITDTKSSDETRQLNKCMDKLRTSDDLQPVPPSTYPPEYGVVVCPGVGHPLHPLAIKHLMFMRSTEVYVDRKWAEFAVAVVTSHKDVSNHDQTEKHVIPIKHFPLLQDLNSKSSPLKNEKVPPLDSEDTLLHTENPKDSNLSVSSLKIIQIFPEPKKEDRGLDPKSSKADENLSSDPSLMPHDAVQLEVKNILKDMINCVLNHEKEDTIMQDDPDVSSTVTVIAPKCPKKAVSKYVKNRVYRELNRLDVNVIVMREDRNGCMEKINGGTICEKDFCQLGCVCASLQTCQPSAAFSDHCGNSECMFECTCQESSKNQSNGSSAGEKPSLLYCTAMCLQDEGNRHLAKVEKEFRHTVIQSKNEVIVIGGGSSGDGGRRRREIKLPERYRDSSVVLGKEFAMAEFKMITGEDVNNSSALSSNHNTRRCERQMYLPSYVEVGVPRSASMSITKPLHKPMRGKLTLEQKISLWCERFKVKPCKIHIERMEGLEGVVPWCMVHMRYDCFCSGQSLKPFKRISYRPVERPPPIPGPPLDSTEMQVGTVKQHSCASRNVAMKSTTHSLNIHMHNIHRHSARTYGTTINYVLRNQSHLFKRHHKSIYLKESETLRNVNHSHYFPLLITQPVNEISKLEITPDESVMQSASFSLSEQEMMPINSVLREDNEEVGFGKIVSIMSLKPEEFEKCGSVDQSQHEDDEACNMDMLVNNEGQFTEALSAGINISEENTHLTQTEMTVLNLDKGQHCHSDEKSHECEVFEKLSPALIPVLPEGSNDINSMRLAELISEKESELRSIMDNCIMSLNLSQSTTGSVQLISWNILLNQLENETYHLWLQYKHGCMSKLIITGTSDKPDQYCISVRDSYPDSPPDFHSQLPPLVTFLIEQLYLASRIPGVNSRDINCFGLLQFDGENWELVGSLLRNVQEVEWCSDQSLHIQTIEQANYQEISERQEQDQNSVSADVTEKLSCITDEQEIIKEAKFQEESENEINVKAVASFIPPNENLRECQCDVDSSQENVDESSRPDEEPAVKQHEQEQESHPCSDLSLREQDLSHGGPILCESTGILIDPETSLGPQMVQGNTLKTAGAGADLKVTDVVCSGLAADGANNNAKAVKSDVELKFATTDVHSAGGELIPVSRKNLSLQSESVCGKDDKVVDSQRQIKSDSTVEDNDSKKITEISPKQKSLVSGKTEVSTNQETTYPLPSPTGTVPFRLSRNGCHSNSIVQTAGVEVPLPTGPDPVRWYMLNIKNRFDLLHLTHSKCIIRYAQLIRAVYLANSHNKTVRVPLDKRLSKEIHSKIAQVSHDKNQTPGSTQPKFGVYTVPNLYTRVFIGPYGLREEAGVGAIKIVNGKLVNTMYLDPQLDSSADVDESITALLNCGGKEAMLNMKMEQLYDSVALAPKDSRVCRGMWLYTTRSGDKASRIRNLKASLTNLDTNRVSSDSTRSFSPPLITNISDESNTAVDENKSQSEMEDRSCGESESISQCSLTDDTGIESRRVVSGLQQTLSAPVTTICHKFAVCKTPEDVGKEFVVEEGEKKQTLKGCPQLAICGSDPRSVLVCSSVKSDSDEEILDVETPCDTELLFHGTHLVVNEKAGCKRTRRNKIIGSIKQQKLVVPEARGDAASVNR